MITQTFEMFEIIKDIDSKGSELNSIKAELRERELELKIKKSKMEFSKDYTDFREGLKVKEIGPKILEETIEDCQVINQLKERRDELEHELYVLKLQFQYIVEVIDSK